MKRFSTYLFICIFLFSSFYIHGQANRDQPFTVVEVYTDPSIQAGEEIQVIGYYTNPNRDLLIDYYGDYIKDRPFSPHTILTLTGADPPPEAWNGGYIKVTGTVSFVDVPDPYHPEDTLMAYLNATSFIVVIPGSVIQFNPGNDKRKLKDRDDGGSPGRENREDCDPCKFAVLISGGVDADNNHAKYWENLVALYQFKVNSQGYCDSNIMVHYYDGTPRDGRIPAARVRKADVTKIDSSFQVIADRVAACNDNGTPATFQKMVTNHGEEDGDICLLGDDVMTPEHLKEQQQKVIDSCCRTVYDEFLQCYGGHSVDAASELDTKNKCTVYANSNANDQCGYSPHDAVHPYLLEKITSLTEGDDYPSAVVKAKLAYDDYLEGLVDDIHNYLEYLRAHDTVTNREALIAQYTADSADIANAICKSRNVTLVPFTHYCQWRKFVVPPGGQIVVEFAGSANSCGNATVYKQNPITGALTKVNVWNWNHPGSYGYDAGNEIRVANGELSGSTIFWIHNDNDTSRLKVHALASQSLPESPPNVYTYPGFSFGGNDNSSDEFTPIVSPTYFVPGIEIIPMALQSLPAILGPGGVQNFGFSFQLDPANAFWSDMELILNVMQLNGPGILQIQSQGGSIPMVQVPMTAPGEYVVPLGDFTLNGPVGIIQMIPLPGFEIELDSWGFRTRLHDLPLQTTTWTGLISNNWDDPDNWTDGVPGLYHHVTIAPGPNQPYILHDVIVTSIQLMNGASIYIQPGMNVRIRGN